MGLKLIFSSLTKINISCDKFKHQRARPTHLLSPIWQKLWAKKIQNAIGSLEKFEDIVYSVL